MRTSGTAARAAKNGQPTRMRAPDNTSSAIWLIAPVAAAAASGTERDRRVQARTMAAVAQATSTPPAIECVPISCARR
jgi:hypothetical protein